MTSATTPDGSAPRVTCIECGGAFAPADTIRYQGNYVCSNCKQAYFERMWAQQEAPKVVEPTFASFGSRFAAKLVDTVIMYVVQLPLTMVLVLGVPREQLQAPGKLPVTFSALVVVVYALSFAITAAYNIYFIGRHGATPGKMALKIKVVSAEGGALSYRRAAARYFAEVLSGLTCFFGYIVAAFDKEGRTLHDHVASTRVVLKA
jgi:uncharacterized RDD family membrane protein YckC